MPDNLESQIFQLQNFAKIIFSVAFEGESFLHDKQSNTSSPLDKMESAELLW